MTTDSPYIDHTRYIEQTRDPLPQHDLNREKIRLWRHALEAVADVVNGQEQERHAERTTPFASTRHAMADLVSVRADGYPQQSLSNPDRLKRHSDGVYAPPDANVESPTIQRADRILEVDRAWRQVFDGPWDDGHVDEPTCRRIALARLVCGWPLWKCAEHFEVPRKTCGRIARYADKRINDHLYARGMVPELDEGGADRSDMRELGFDLDGWKEIASALGRSVTTAKDWSEDKDDPLPVYRVRGRVVAKSKEVREWWARQLIRA